MNLVGRVVSSVSEFYKDLNPATLSGAIDVVVVDQGNGDLACSPFHVRFGKLKLLRPSEKVVEITINNNPTDLRMKVGEAGEAFFVFETDTFVPSEYSTSPIQSPESEMSDVEPLDIDRLPLGLSAGSLSKKLLNLPQVKQGPPSYEASGTKHEDWRLEDSSTGSKLNVSTATDNLQMMSSALYESEIQLKPLEITSMSSPALSSPVLKTSSDDSTPNVSQLSTLLQRRESEDPGGLKTTTSWASIPEDNAPPTLERLSLGDIREGKELELSPERRNSSEQSSDQQLFQSLSTHTPQIDDIITEAYGAKPVAKYPVSNSPELQHPGEPRNFSVSTADDSPSRKYSFSTLKTWWNRTTPSTSPSVSMNSPPAKSVDLHDALRPGLVLGTDSVAHPHAKHLNEEARQTLLDSRKSLPIHIRSKSHDGVSSQSLVTEHEGRLQSHSPISERSVSPEKDSISESGRDLRHRFAKTLRLTSDQLKSLKLERGSNKVVFSVATNLQGKQSCEAMIYLYDSDTKLVISDIDGTITKSDALGHIFTMVGRDWTHLGVASLYTNIVRNGYEIMYLTSRAIGQASSTRDYLKRVEQGQYQLPVGPVIMSPDRLLRAFHREVIRRRPEEFKIACLKDIRALFADRNPFYAGFGNRITDAIAYRSVDVPPSRIFTIDPSGELKWQLLDQYKSSYVKLNDLVDQIFPAVQKALPTEFNDHNYWKQPLPQINITELDDYEEEELYEDELDEEDYEEDEEFEEEYDESISEYPGDDQKISPKLSSLPKKTKIEKNLEKLTQQASELKKEDAKSQEPIY